MKTIRKFQLDEWLKHEEVQMPVGAQVLSAANLDGKLCLWALVDPSAPHESRFFEVIGTGHSIYEQTGVERRFIGTVLIAPNVWHVFERL